MSSYRQDELGSRLATELHRYAAATSVDVLDAHARLDDRVRRDRNRAVLAVAVVVALLLAGTTLLLADPGHDRQVIDSQPSPGLTVSMVARYGEPRGQGEFFWPWLEAVRSNPAVSSLRWEAAAGYDDGRRALNAAAQGSNVVLILSPDLQGFAGPVAEAHPSTRYVVVDGVVEGVSAVPVVDLGAEQSAFLAGALAASVSATGRLGVVFGARIETTESLAAGFVAGARAVRPDVAVDVRYLTVHPDLTGFLDVDAQEQIAEGMYSDGADVVFGDAAIAAAARLSAAGGTYWAVGVDGDRRASAGATEQAVILTSVVKDFPKALGIALELISSGRLDGDRTLGLASGVTWLGEQAPEARQYADVLAGFEAQIRSGEIVVPVSDP